MKLNTDFSEHVVLITGAAQGIGTEIAQSFVESGAEVYLADIDRAGVERTANAVGAACFAVDLADPDATGEMISNIRIQSGCLDILVHAAGGVCAQVSRPIEDVAMEDWRSIFAANVDSAFCLARAVAPLMKDEHWGRIINIASGAGLRPSLTGIQAYAAAKHALVGLTRQLSQELGPFGITVNAIAPGLVLSNPSSRKQWQGYTKAVQREIIERTHTRRLGEPQDVAAAVLYFASEAAGWVSGQVLSVDGGHS